MSTWGDIGTVAAPTVVAVTALWFNSRQQVQSRDHDRIERQKERDHDGAMREAAERHERKLSDLDYQRQLVDDVAVALERAVDAAVHLKVRLLVSSGEDHKEEIESYIRDVSTADNELRMAKARIMLRFGPDNEAVSIVRQASEAVRQVWATAVSHTFLGTDKDKTETALDAECKTLRGAVNAFLPLVGGIVGSAPERD